MVTTWSDQSPNADTLSAGAMAPDRLEVEIKGAPTVQLQATATMTLSGPHAGAAVAFGTGELLVEVVACWYPSVTLLQTDRGLAVSGGATAQVSVAGHAVQTTAIVGDGTCHLVGARRGGSGAGTTLEMRVNGGVDGTATGLDYAQDLGAASPAPVALLGPGNNVEIAELVVVNGATTSADLARSKATSSRSTPCHDPGPRSTARVPRRGNFPTLLIRSVDRWPRRSGVPGSRSSSWALWWSRPGRGRGGGRT
jgi:hypothetical protein